MERLPLALKQYELLSKTPSVFVILDPFGQCLYINERSVAFFGHLPTYFIDQSWSDILGSLDIDFSTISLWKNAIHERRSMDLIMHLPNNRMGVTWVSCQGVMLQDEEANGASYLITLTDVTALKLAEKSLREQVMFDPLTGLPNRQFFTQSLARSIHIARRREQCFALLILELDNFHIINEQFNWMTGDALLTEIAVQLQRRLRKSDIIARIGGAKFAVILENIGSIDFIIPLIETITAKLLPMPLEGDQSISVTMSAGISIFPESADSAELLLLHAEKALALANEKGNGQYQFFNDTLDKAAKRTYQLTLLLQQTIEEKTIDVVFQPVINIRDHSILMYETLVRWHTEPFGDIPPMELIQLAQRLGVMGALEMQIIEKGLLQRQAYIQQGGLDLPIAFNISSSERYHEQFAQKIALLASVYQCKVDNIYIEFKESFFTEDDVAAKIQFAALKKAGFKFILDDYGNATSSLMLLHHYAIDYLKIDMDLWKLSKEDYQGIVSAILILSRAKSVEVIAEGVETIDQLNLLKEIGCDFAEGFYFQKPEPLPGMLCERADRQFRV